jgi:hypothetical protein
MTCLFNARAYRDASAAAPRRPDTSYTGYWAVVGLYASTSCLVYRARSFRDGAPRACAGCADGHRSSQRQRDLQSIQFSCAPAGPGVGPGVGPRAGPARFLARAFGIQLAVATCSAKHPLALSPSSPSRDIHCIIRWALLCCMWLCRTGSITASFSVTRLPPASTTCSHVRYQQAAGAEVDSFFPHGGARRSGARKGEKMPQKLARCPVWRPPLPVVPLRCYCGALANHRAQVECVVGHTAPSRSLRSSAGPQVRCGGIWPFGDLTTLLVARISWRSFWCPAKLRSPLSSIYDPQKGNTCALARTY